jgi:pyrimidine-nucleoside phosphorylase
MLDLITKKRDNQALSKAEIDFIIKDYTSGNIPDYHLTFANHNQILQL